MEENRDWEPFDLPSILNSKELNIRYNIMMNEHQGDQSVLASYTATNALPYGPQRCRSRKSSTAHAQTCG